MCEAPLGRCVNKRRYYYFRITGLHVLTASFIVAAPGLGSHSERRIPLRPGHSQLPQCSTHRLDERFLASGTDLPEEVLYLREGFL